MSEGRYTMAETTLLKGQEVIIAVTVQVHPIGPAGVQDSYPSTLSLIFQRTLPFLQILSITLLPAMWPRELKHAATGFCLFLSDVCSVA